MNRFFFDINHSLDKHAAQPAASFYKRAMPEFIQIGFHNFISNLNEPVTFTNDALQGDFGNAGDSVTRFALNTTLGAAGFVDVATERGFPDRPEDLGITLGKYGVPGGPYLVLPLLGSENVRDLAGRFADSYFEPTRYFSYPGKVEASYLLRGVGALDQRSRNTSILSDIERTSIDYYAATRSIYSQSRESRIHDGEPAAENLPQY